MRLYGTVGRSLDFLLNSRGAGSSPAHDNDILKGLGYAFSQLPVYCFGKVLKSQRRIELTWGFL